MHFYEWQLCIFNRIPMTFVPKGPIDNKSSLVQGMAWRRTGVRPLPEPVLTKFTDAYMRHSGEMKSYRFHWIINVVICMHLGGRSHFVTKTLNCIANNPQSCNLSMHRRAAYLFSSYFSVASILWIIALSAFTFSLNARHFRIVISSEGLFA